MNVKLKYIPEIDSLRAIAVISVILFHAKINILNFNFEGGLFGVDIFFVISGYLISKLIILEINEKNSFNLKSFYLRRIRRILPALTIVALFTFPFAWLLLLPISLIEYIWSLITGVFFTSNIFFFLSEIKYNATPSLYKPLLHYWSLSVEEQFYFVYPFTLFLIIRYLNKNFYFCILILAFTSFIFALFLSYKSPSLNFYLFPTRIWEFLVGALAAKMHIDQHRFTKIKASFIFQLIGVVFLIISILLINNLSLIENFQKIVFYKIFFSHPGFITLLPVLGTFLVIIFVNNKNFINNFLTFKPIVFIGLISYSLYLWHLPIFSFIRISTIDINTKLEYFFVLIIIFGLSILSYYLIEKPFRNKNFIKNIYVLSFVLLITLIIIFLSYISIKSNGFSKLVPEYFKEFKITDKSGNQLFDKNNMNKKFDNMDLYNPFNEKKFGNVLIIGDSHAGDLTWELKESLNRRNLNLFMLGFSNIFSLDFFNIRRDGEIEYLKEKLNNILSNRDVSTVILMSRYPLYWHREGFDNNQNNGKEILSYVNYFKDQNSQNLPDTQRLNMISDSFNNSIIELLNKEINVIIIYPTPEAGFWIPEYLASKLLPRYKIKYLLDKLNINNNYKALPMDKYVTTPYDLYWERNKEVFNMLDQIKHPNLYRFYPHKKFCDIEKNSCYTHDDNSIYYRDNNHLSKSGLKMIIPDIIKIFDRIEIN